MKVLCISLNLASKENIATKYLILANAVIADAFRERCDEVPNTLGKSS